MNQTALIHTAKPLDVIAELNFPEVEHLINGFAQELNIENGKKYISMILCNALYHAMCGHGFYVSRDCHVWADYNRQTTLKEQKISVRKLNATLDYLVKKGYLKEIRGHKDFTISTNSYRSRYFATEALLFIFNTKHTFHKHIFNTKHTNIIRLKKNKHDIQLNTNDLPLQIKFRKADLESLNDTYSNYLFTCIKNNQKLRISINLQSVYTEDWEHGGRLYATCTDGNGFTYQTLKKAERKTIEINGEGTVEPDFHCLHINLAYNIFKEKDLIGDAYDFVPDRKFAKKVILISLNCTSREQAINALLDDTYVKNRYNYLDVEFAITNMLNRHSIISDLFFTSDNLGLRLQNLDSDIMLEILKACETLNIPVIPVHDSCICRKSDATAVMALMRSAYYTLTKHEIQVAL